jgi:hypothetical protein
MGESGCGKSTSIRNLDAKETYLINVLGKSLPFKSKGYKPKENYFQSDDAKLIAQCIRHISLKKPDIKTIVIDDFGYLMTTSFMHSALERGYDKYSILAKDIWEVIQAALKSRDDLIIYFIGHVELTMHGTYKFKTIGKMLDDKVVIEGMFPMVLHAQVNDKFEHQFVTQNNGVVTAKAPLGLFDDVVIDNDLSLVNQAIRAYYED